MKQTIVVGHNVEVTVDFDSKGKCRKCGQEIYWAVTKNNKNMPVTYNSQYDSWDSHFATCPFANEFRRKHETQDTGVHNR